MEVVSAVPDIVATFDLEHFWSLATNKIFTSVLATYENYENFTSVLVEKNIFFVKKWCF
jgi:hypothetical protein